MQPGETLAVIGPSGAGKTSLLRTVAGLETPSSGELLHGGENLLRLPAERRGMAMVFQDDALFEHLSVRANLAFGMRRRSESRIREAARALEIEGLLGERPSRLSGGQRQRAALARAVLSDPRALLLDEPLVHLDPQLRERVRATFAAALHAWNGPVVFVTHDHREALALGGRIAIMIAGRIVQCDTPQIVYEKPASLDAARFFGSPAMNLLDDPMHILGIRAEHVRIDPSAPLRGVVLSAELAGADTYVRASTRRGAIVARVRTGTELPAAGEETGFAFDERDALRYDRSTGLLRQ